MREPLLSSFDNVVLLGAGSDPNGFVEFGPGFSCAYEVFASVFPFGAFERDVLSCALCVPAFPAIGAVGFAYVV